MYQNNRRFEQINCSSRTNKNKPTTGTWLILNCKALRAMKNAMATSQLKQNQIEVENSRPMFVDLTEKLDLTHTLSLRLWINEFEGVV